MTFALGKNKNQHCKLYTKKKFENILPIANRFAAILAQKKVSRKFKSKINYNFFTTNDNTNKYTVFIKFLLIFFLYKLSMFKLNLSCSL